MRSDFMFFLRKSFVVSQTFGAPLYPIIDFVQSNIYIMLRCLPFSWERTFSEAMNKNTIRSSFLMAGAFGQFIVMIEKCVTSES